MSDQKIVKYFEGKPVTFDVINGEMVLTLEQVRELLGLSAEELEKIIEEHKEELVPYLRQTVEPATLVKVRELKQVPEC